MSLYKLQKGVKRSRSSKSPFTPAVTKQSFKDDCDVNRIMSKYQSTGVLEHVKYMKENSLRYGDFTGFDFRDVCDRIVQAQEMFDALPAKLRYRFENDPAQFLDFVSDVRNKDEMVSLGLIPPSRSKDSQESVKKATSSPDNSATVEQGSTVTS